MEYWQRIRQAVGKDAVIIPSAAGAIVQEGKILPVRHNLLKKWQIPGGLQEIGESVIASKLLAGQSISSCFIHLPGAGKIFLSNPFRPKWRQG
jgi:hypothetical protein